MKFNNHKDISIALSAMNIKMINDNTFENTKREKYSRIELLEYCNLYLQSTSCEASLSFDFCISILSVYYYYGEINQLYDAMEYLRVHIAHSYKNLMDSLYQEKNEVETQDNKDLFYLNMLKKPFGCEIFIMLDQRHDCKKLSLRIYLICHIIKALSCIDINGTDKFFSDNQTSGVIKNYFICYMLSKPEFMIDDFMHFINSSIPFFKALVAFRIFHLSRFTFSYQEKIQIEKLNELVFTDNEKIYIFFYYSFSKYASTIGLINQYDDEVYIDFTSEIHKLVRQLFSIETFNYSIFYNDIICNLGANHGVYKILMCIMMQVRMINRINNFNVLCDQLIKDSIEFVENNFSNTGCDNKDLSLGKQIQLFYKWSGINSTKLNEEIKKKYIKIYKKIYQPYIFFRNRQLWTSNIYLMRFYLIILEAIDVLDVSLVSQYINVKNNYPHPLDNYFNLNE